MYIIWQIDKHPSLAEQIAYAADRIHLASGRLPTTILAHPSNVDALTSAAPDYSVIATTNSPVVQAGTFWIGRP